MRSKSNGKEISTANDVVLVGIFTMFIANSNYL